MTNYQLPITNRLSISLLIGNCSLVISHCRPGSAGRRKRSGAERESSLAQQCGTRSRSDAPHCDGLLLFRQRVFEPDSFGALTGGFLQLQTGGDLPFSHAKTRGFHARPPQQRGGDGDQNPMFALHSICLFADVTYRSISTGMRAELSWLGVLCN